MNGKSDIGVSFYCKDCKADQNLIPYKRSNRFGEWFVAKCLACRSEVIRYITNKHLDPYYRDSLELRKQRDKLAKDLIQPGDSRFKLYYKKEWDKLEVAAQKYDEKVKREKESRDRYYDQFKYAPSRMKKIVKTVLEKEEQM